MSARHKLNRANFTWAMVLGLLFGWMCDSFSAFVVATIIFVASAWHTGDIRAEGDYHYPGPTCPPRPRVPNHQTRSEQPHRRRRSRR